LFGAAALLGGTVGVAIREWSVRGRKRGKQGIRARVASVLLGFLIAVAYAIGVNLLPIVIPGPVVEASVFVVAGLGAILGLAVLQSRLEAPKKSADSTTHGAA
jgi:hypothetical protein